MSLKISRYSLFLILCILVLNAYSQTPQTFSSADIYLQLKKLKVLGSVLYIAAHPDDENTRLLTFLSKEKLYRTGYLSLTRGDGGQNLIGNEQGIELGLIRTQELLAARRIDGAEQFFSRAYDFGYSKSAEEALRIWNKEKILSDVVWVIRMFQPDVIITRFPGDERAGHGHHAASALLANEAFAAAAEANKFPEQLQNGVKPWQAKRILWNTFNFGGTNTTSEDQLKIDVGGYNSLLGKSYGEIAAESRSQHKSQGFGVARQRGTMYEYFKATGGSSPQHDLMDSIVTDWSRVDGTIKIETSVNHIIAAYSFEHPEKSVTALVALYKEMNKLQNAYWKSKKMREVQQLIEACSGMYAEATTPSEFVVQNDSLSLNVSLNKRSDANIIVRKIEVKGSHSAESLAVIEFKQMLGNNENITKTFSFFLPENFPVSQPYWLKYPMLTGSFNVIEQAMIGRAESVSSFVAEISVEIEGENFILQRPVQYKYTDAVKGELFQPVVVLPQVSVQEEPSLLVFSNQHDNKMKVKYKANSPVKNLVVKMQRNDWLSDTVAMKKGEERNFESAFDVAAKPGSNQNSSGNSFTDTFTLQNGNPAVYPVSIHYDHIPNITYFKPAVQTALFLNVKVEGKKVGYIAGAGDKVPQALQQVGYSVTMLDEKDLTWSNLQQYDAILTGVRAYNVHEWLAAKSKDLLNYVNNGGNLIVQYNTNNQLGIMKGQTGPYPFTISRSRITDENAMVNFAIPNHPALNYPNKLTAKDFEGWIQERSIYQAEQVDSNYVMPLTMSDPGEKPSGGSLIIGKYGKGNFVYTGLVFFRELPAGVPGAYRLFSNLISLPKNNAK